MSTKTTLKILALFVICAATLMSGCMEVDDPISSEDISTQPPVKISTPHLIPTISPTQISTPEPIPTIPTRLDLDIGHTAYNSQTEVTVISVYKKYYYEYMGYGCTLRSQEANNGNTFVIASVNMKNVGQNRDYLGSNDLSITDSKGYRYDNSYYHGDGGLECIQELYQNQQMEGIVIFEVPKDATGLEIQYDFGNIFGKTQIASWEID